jgi:hypothetical protein
MKDFMDISVALTTTEYSFITDGGDNQMEIDLILQNVPVLVAETSMYFSSISDDLKKQIHNAISTKVDTVDINSNLRTVFIGENIEKEETGLVLYQDLKHSPRADAFFKRWDEIHTLLYEYTIKSIDLTGKENGIIACVRGVRAGNTWVRLEIVDEPNIHIKERV